MGLSRRASGPGSVAGMVSFGVTLVLMYLGPKRHPFVSKPDNKLRAKGSQSMRFVEPNLSYQLASCRSRAQFCAYQQALSCATMCDAFAVNP